MNEYQKAFDGYWKECCNAVYYRLNSDKEMKVLKDSKRVAVIVQQEVWKNRFHSVVMRHGARVWLDELEAANPITGKEVRLKIFGFTGAGGVNSALVMGVATAALMLIIAAAIVAIATGCRAAGAIAATGILGALGLAGLVSAGLFYGKSLRTADEVKRAFEETGEQIKQLLATL